VSEHNDFCILSLKHSTGLVCRWWGPDNSGYVDTLDEAGHYSAATVTARLGYYNDGRNTCALPWEMAEAYACPSARVKRLVVEPGRVVPMRFLEALRLKKPRGVEVLEAVRRCLAARDLVGADLRLALLLEHPRTKGRSDASRAPCLPEVSR
jgi:hypothetical protein